MNLFGIPVLWTLAIGFTLFMLVLLLVALSWRVVVSTNAVHIVQSSKARTSYGGVDENNKPRSNTYYSWPSWLPVIGVKVSNLPLSVFDLPLNDYSAYDKGRLPFLIDMMAFFRINDSGTAAERVQTFLELEKQLEYILKGAARTILATSEIGEIMESRAVFGEKFTAEVEHQLKQWGVTPVKNIELMDLRDAPGSSVIAQIMAKKKSEIDKESRTTVAANTQEAETKEIEARRQVALSAQEAEQTVGLRTAEKDKMVGIAKQEALQAVAESSKATAEKNMAVKQVNDTRTADIAKTVAETVAAQNKNVNITNAEASQQVAVKNAEGEKQRQMLVAEGKRDAMVAEAVGTKAKGEAEGAAQTAVLMAPVNSQLELSKGIGGNKDYQAYMINMKQVEAFQAIGVQQADALKAAQIKVIVTGGTPGEGMKNVMDLFTPIGAARVGAAVEALRNASETADGVLARVDEAKSEPKKPNGQASVR